MAKKTKKLIIAGAIVAGLLVLALVAVLFTEFDSPELGRLALGQVGEASGFDLQARGFRLNLLRGLELEEVEARAVDGGLTASVEKVVLKHRPADLLGGTLTVTEILIKGPRVELVDEGEATADEPPPAGETPAAGDGTVDATAKDEATSLDLAISSIRIEDGSLVQRVSSDGATETTEVRGLEVEIHDLLLGSDPAAGEPAGRGEIRIAEIELSDGVATTTVRGVELDLEALALDRGLSLEGTSLAGAARFAEVVTSDEEETATLAEDVRGAFELEGGRFQMRELELSTPQGALQGALIADVAAEPLTYSLDLHGDALNTAVLLGLAVPPEGDKRNMLGGLGTSRFELKASGEGSEPEGIAGQGRLTVGGGELPDHPVLAQVEQLLGNVVLIGAGYEAFPLEFDIREHRVHLAPCELRVGPVSLTAGGWVDLDGPLEMELTVLAPREGLRIKEIPDEVLEVLAEDDGRVNLPMLVSGTADGSAVGLNKVYLEQLGKRYVRKRAEQEIGKALRDLLGDN